MGRTAKPRLVVTLASLISLGCQSGAGASSSTSAERAEGEPASAVTQPAPPAEWDEYRAKLTLRELPGQDDATIDVDFSVDALGHLEVAFDKLPPGTKLSLGEHGYEVTGDEPFDGQRFSVDLRAQLADLPLSVLEDEYAKRDFGLSLMVELPGYEALTQTVPALQLTSGFTMWLGTVREGPLRFAGEPAEVEPEARRVGLLYSELGGIQGVFGAGPEEKTLRDVDRIAVSEMSYGEETKTCEGYDLGDFELELVASEVTVYDRRTGEALAQERFEANEACPKHASVNEDNRAKAYADLPPIRKWVKSKI